MRATPQASGALWAALLGSGSLLVGGCLTSVGDSCTVPTHAISMVATVVDNGMSIRAEADFEEGDRRGLSFPLELCPDDVLTINGEAPRMTEKVGRIVY